MDPAGSDLTQEKGHPPGLTEAGEELKPPENFFLPSVTQKTELIRILRFLRTWVNQGLYVIIFFSPEQYTEAMSPQRTQYLVKLLGWEWIFPELKHQIML